METIKFLSLREYAIKHGISKETARNLCKNNDLENIKDGYIPAKVDTTWILYKID